MKNIYLAILLGFSAILSAQKIEKIYLLNNGKKSVICFTIDKTKITMDCDGNIISLINYSSDSKLSTKISEYAFNSDTEIDYEDPKNPFSLNDVFEYYDDFYDYNAGKLKSINNINFNYYDGFYSYLKGKIESIGEVNFTYYDDFYHYQVGKLKSVGSIEFSYFDDFYRYKSGKLKSIKGNKENILITVSND